MKIKNIIRNIFKKNNKEKVGNVKMEDKILKCLDCDEEFIFTLGEQEFFESNQFQEPKRCPACRRARKQEKNNREY